MNTIQAVLYPTSCVLNQDFECGLSVRSPSPTALGFMKLCEIIDVTGLDRSRRSLRLYGHSVRLNLLKLIKAKEDYGASLIDECSRESSENSSGNLKSNFFKPIKAKEDPDSSLNDDSPAFKGMKFLQNSTVGNSTNILWHECPIQKGDRQQLLQQRGCVIWLTGLSGSGKSTLACALSRSLYFRGKLSYVLDGDNIRHGLNCDLSFGAEDRSENIRMVGEVAKLFADAGVICITSLISPYRRDRDASRALLPEGDFIEVFIDVPLHVCEARDPRGLYKLARAGKIKGFTGIDDPYEPPHDCEVVLQHNGIDCLSPSDTAEKVISWRRMDTCGPDLLERGLSSRCR